MLVIDDEAVVRDGVVRMLKALGYLPFVAQSPQASIALFQAHQFEIDVVILDFNMPEIYGDIMYERLSTLKPSVKVILSTGYGPEGAIERMLQNDGVAYLGKPYGIKQLGAQLAKLLGSQATLLSQDYNGEA